MYSDSEDEKSSISTRLSNILKDYLNLPGPLIHVQPYSLEDSPNICFSVKDLKILQLPLDMQDAQAMTARADSISEPFCRFSPGNARRIIVHGRAEPYKPLAGTLPTELG